MGHTAHITAHFSPDSGHLTRFFRCKATDHSLLERQGECEVHVGKRQVWRLQILVPVRIKILCQRCVIRQCFRIASGPGSAGARAGASEHNSTVRERPDC
jgi:hypothetical protein